MRPMRGLSSGTLLDASNTVSPHLNTPRSSSASIWRYNPASASLRQVRGARVGLCRGTDSRFWWMSYLWKGEQYFESIKCRGKALANKILSKREGEIPM
jgi:hypothetical protein